MLSYNLIILLLSIGVFNFAEVHGKTFTVCELVQELDDLRTISRDEIYKHLCIIGSMMHTHKTRDHFLGLYSIGSKWWCGQDAPGGNCNVTCSDLLDDDIADDVACAQKIIDSHGLQDGWGNSEQECKRSHESKVKDCLETVDEFEYDAEWIHINFTKKSETTTELPPTTLAPSTSTKSIAASYLENHNMQISNRIAEKHSVFSVSNFFIAIAFIAVIAIISIFIVRYHRVERFLRATFTDNVQLV